MFINELASLAYNFFSKKSFFFFLISAGLIFVFLRKGLREDNIYSGLSNKDESFILFEELGEKMGLDYKHVGVFPFTRNQPVENEFNLQNGLAPSISVMDINTDGYPDLYVTYPILGEKNLIYINGEGREFIKSNQYSNIRDVNQEFVSMRAGWFDFNEDGHEDLFIARFGCHSLYLYDPLKQIYNEEPNAVSYCSNPWGINIVDLNKDSYLDIAFANYYPQINLNKEKPKWFLFLLRGDEEFGGKNAYLINKKGRSFFVDKTNVFQYKNHSSAIGVSDINNDTWPDIFVANDFTYDRLYLNIKGVLKEVTFSYIEGKNHGFAGMNAEFIDLNNDLWPDLYISNLFHPPYVNRRNLLWLNQSGQKFTEQGKKFKIHKCGWSWGAKFADFDNDGDLDLVVGNGFVRGSRSQKGKYNQWFSKIRRDATMPFIRDNLHTNQGGVDDFSLVDYSGFQETCIFENKGKEFSNISKQANVGGFYNSRATIILDFNNDGKMDFLTGNYNDKLNLYKNVSSSQGNWVAFDIRNKKGAIALGAKVILSTQSGRKFMRETYPHNGFGGQNDWRVHFGIGSEQPKSLEVQYRGQLYSIKLNKVNEYIKITI